jgi:hypothetical protein
MKTIRKAAIRVSQKQNGERRKLKLPIRHCQGFPGTGANRSRDLSGRERTDSLFRIRAAGEERRDPI